MNDRLESLISEARAERASFDTSRSLAAAQAKKGLRERRRRLVRRSVLTFSGMAFVALLVMRTSFAPSSASAAAPILDTPAHEQQELASRALDDGGFARD